MKTKYFLVLVVVTSIVATTVMVAVAQAQHEAHAAQNDHETSDDSRMSARSAVYSNSW